MSNFYNELASLVVFSNVSSAVSEYLAWLIEDNRRTGGCDILTLEDLEDYEDEALISCCDGRVYTRDAINDILDAGAYFSDALSEMGYDNEAAGRLLMDQAWNTMSAILEEYAFCNGAWEDGKNNSYIIDNELYKNRLEVVKAFIETVLACETAADADRLVAYEADDFEKAIEAGEFHFTIRKNDGMHHPDALVYGGVYSGDYILTMETADPLGENNEVLEWVIAKNEDVNNVGKIKIAGLAFEWEGVENMEE